MWCQAGSIFTGQCPWAVSGKVWQMLRAAVAVGAVYTIVEIYIRFQKKIPNKVGIGIIVLSSP